ncbi:MAG: phosphoglucosamine mutase [Clostridiales bacterium]|jgi:phosphoglucosamine mutase|nr:phosphoglucosamine mutase [Clostridiales bacterium]
MGILFGTDGVRGVANAELTPELAFRLGQAGAMVLTSERHKPRILIGKDTRMSSEMLEAALIAGICSVGAEAELLGVIPTPAVAYLTRVSGADAGIVISASHNPMEYNGIKFFNSSGYKLSDRLENDIEEIILHTRENIPRPTGAEIGRVVHNEQARNDYIQYLISTMECRLDGMKIAIDCANGANSSIAGEVLSSLGAETQVINNQPNGANINLNCGSTAIGGISEYVVKTGADLGLAFDGDADRVLAVDEHGKLVDGDKILAICGAHMKKQGKLAGNTIVATVMSNLGLTIAARNEGIDIVSANVGDRFVLEQMLKGGFNLGGEQSGHIIFLDYNTTGDGLLTGLRLAEICKTSGKKLSELAGIMQVMPQVLINAKVASDKKYTYSNHAGIMSEIAVLESEFAGEGRVLIRPSGTEPLVRVMIEGKDRDRLETAAKKLANYIEKELA